MKIRDNYTCPLEIVHLVAVVECYTNRSSLGKAECGETVIISIWIHLTMF